jgi:putative SOS response-associated peptidase YedK
MCGRYQVSTEEEIIEMREIIGGINERYKDKPDLSAMKTGEIFPTETAPVLVSQNGESLAALMKWGFSRWNSTSVIINARSETAMEKKSFHASLLNRRCIIPTTGFYEWQKREGGKTKYLFRLPETKMLYLAGLYEKSPLGDTYVIMTTAANPSMSLYHDRMPLILHPDVLSQWLMDTDYALAYIQQPCLSQLIATAVS